MAVVASSILPALLPMSAMATVTNPRMTKGMTKPRNWLNVALKVTKILTRKSGKKLPARIPSIMAMTMRGKSPMRVVFMVFSMFCGFCLQK